MRVIKLNNIVFWQKFKKGNLFYFRISEIKGTGQNATVKARLISKEQARSRDCPKQGFFSRKTCDFFLTEKRDSVARDSNELTVVKAKGRTVVLKAISWVNWALLDTFIRV